MHRHRYREHAPANLVPESVREGRLDAVSDSIKAVEKPSGDDDADNEADEPDSEEQSDEKNVARSEAHEETSSEEHDEPQTAFAHFADFMHLILLYALPVAALSVAFLWTRFKLTFRITAAAFIFSFLVPLLIALCPWSWWGYVEPVASSQKQPLQNLERRYRRFNSSCRSTRAGSNCSDFTTDGCSQWRSQ